METLNLCRPVDSGDELFTAWQQCGDERARERLVAEFMPLAHLMARRYAGGSEPLEDLQQIAALALLKAIDRFDPEHGTTFASFAIPTILGELKRHFRDCGWSVHVPRGAQEAALKVDQAERFLATTGRSPTVGQLAEHLGWGDEQVLTALETGMAQYAKSLDAPVGSDDEDEPQTLADGIGGPDRRLENVDEVLSFASAMRRLPMLERRVLAMRFVDGLTQSQAAAELGVSQMQISRILRRASEQLRAEAG